MKHLLTLVSVLLFSLVTFAGPTQKVVKCDNLDYTGIASAVELALTEKDVSTNDSDALEYIKGVMPQELGGFVCTKVFNIGPVFSIPEETTEVYVLEDNEFILKLIVTTNKIEKQIKSVNTKLIDVKFY